MLKSATLLALVSLPLLAGGALRTVEVTTQDTLDYTSGAIHIDTRCGQINVEGWDEPRVAVTVSRTTFRHDTPPEEAAGKRYLERIQVKVTRAQDGGVRIATVFPGRNWLVRTVHGFGDFNLNYRIQAPRNAKLAINQGDGDVVVYGMAGDIDASVSAGDIVVQVPQPDKTAADARVWFGDVFSELPGPVHIAHLTGESYVASGAAGAQHLHLKTGVGGISVQ